MTAIATADFNGDRKPDLAYTNRLNSEVVIMIGDGTGKFSLPGSHQVGDDPAAIVAADFNLDGQPDLAVASTSSRDVTILENGSRRRFSTAARINLGAQPTAIAAGDFNGDARPDLATLNPKQLSLSVVISKNNGAFEKPLTLKAQRTARHLIAADINADGRADLVTADETNNTVSVYLAERAGFGTPKKYPVGGRPFWVMAADVNYDGRLDLLTANHKSGSVSVLLADRDGFKPTGDHAVGPTPTTLLAGNFESRSHADLLVTHYATANSSLLRIGSEFGVLGAQNFATGSKPYSAVAADFNSDQIDDLAVANSSSGDVSIFIAASDGFEVMPRLSLGKSLHGIASADFDGNGCPDLALTDTTSQRLLVLLNGAACKSSSNLLTGNWGGQGISFNAGNTQTTLEFDCAHGKIAQPIELTAGAFSVPGTVVNEPAGSARGIMARDESGGMRGKEIAIERKVVFLGQVKSDSMTLSMKFPGSDEIAKTFRLSKDALPKLRKCR